MNAKKFLISGILAGIVILIISQLFDLIIQMFGPPYNVMDLAGMRNIKDPLILLFFAHYWVISFAMAIVYPYLSNSLKGTFMQKGQTFGLLMWLIGGFTSAFIVFTSMDYPIGFTISSLIGSLLYSVGAGITIAKLME